MPPLTDQHILFLSWRDRKNPEGGGAELYLDQMARGLVERGARVTVFSAAHAGAAPDEVVDGIRYVRRGNKMGVYGRGIEELLLRRFDDVDLVVDVQNGLPFMSRLATRKPVIVLVHHVHREQWPVVYPGPIGRIGWWVERRLAPWIYRNCQYIAVSSATRDELVELGVDRERIAIVHNGTAPAPDIRTTRTPHPSLCTVGRLVPHKQVEHAIDVCHWLAADFEDIVLKVAGDGWWSEELREHARTMGVADRVHFEGHVSEERKHEIYAESWLQVLPSLKEGWGLVIGEAGLHSTPTIAYRSAGGTRESIEDGVSGILVDDFPELVEEVREVLSDPKRLAMLSAGAQQMSHRFTWARAQASFARVVETALHGGVMDGQDPGGNR